MKKRLLSLLLVLALALSICSVCALAADTAVSQTEQSEAESVDTAEAAGKEAGTDEDAASDTPEDRETDTDASDEDEDVETEEDVDTDEKNAAEDEETDADKHLHEVDHMDACVKASFEPLTVTGGTLESGCYYLTQDIALTQPLCVPKNGAQVTLCLNGYTLCLDEGAEGCLIYVAVSDEGAEPSVLTIIDCNGAQRTSNYYVDESGALIFDDGSFTWQEAYIAAKEKNALSGGRMTGATAGAISVGDYNELYLTDVNIIDNTGRYGAGVVIAGNAKAVLDGCVIAGNRLTGEMKQSERQILGGGVYCAGSLELRGATHISGNRADETQNDLWLDETAELTVGEAGLDEQARIGVSGEDGQKVLRAYSDDFSKNFMSNDPTLCIHAAQENGFTELLLQGAVYTLTLEPGADEEPVTLDVGQGQSLDELDVNAPQREGAAFAGWYTVDEIEVNPAQPLHLTADTTFHAVWTQPETDESQGEEKPQADTLCDPETPLTRSQAVQLLYGLAKQAGLTETEAKNDAPELPQAILALDEAAQQAFFWALENGLVREDACEQPDEILTQEQMQTLLAALLALQPEA